jgi:pantetheine-phosphate adenylyltransferase
MSKNIIAIYPGSFDPITCGHVDIIVRGSTIFDEVIVAVLENIDKKALFSVDERLGMIGETFSDRPNVKADAFTGLLVDYAQSKGATAIVRGVRAISDFEYEFQMALMNRRLAPAIETVFMMPAEEYSYVSSRLIKEVAILGGSVNGLVPAGVERQLKGKLQL